MCLPSVAQPEALDARPMKPILMGDMLGFEIEEKWILGLFGERGLDMPNACWADKS
jgi:hypothetical protein